jgi:hypothetical protein
MVGELIRHPALRLLPLEFPTFPQAIVKKEKGPKRKKAAATVPLLSSKLIGESNYKGNPRTQPFFSIGQFCLVRGGCAIKKRPPSLLAQTGW